MLFFSLEFYGTNNVAKYESLFLGLNLDKYFGIKLLNIIGDSNLIILQVKCQFACKNQRFKRYMNAV
jgi:ribonuclease HI